jgi:hypothetical protein
MLIQSVITEADDHHNGITMHFSSLPVVGGFAGLLSTGVLAPLFVPDVTQALALVEEGTLLAELAVPGGTGCSFFDMFWITGN